MFKNATLYIALFMVAVFLFLGFYLLITDVQVKGLEGGKRVFFVALLFAYASYRGYRLYHAFKQNRDN